MKKDLFEGTIVLEKVARINKLEEFMAAVDSEDTNTVIQLMEKAGLDEGTIAIVLEKMADPFDEH